MNCFVGKLLYWYGVVCACALLISLLFACWMWIDYKWDQLQQLRKEKK